MNELIITGSFVLDIVFGDPPLLFSHPIALIGILIEKTEKYFFSNNRLNGLFFTIFICVCVWIATDFFLKIIDFFNQNISFLFAVILGSFTLSLRSLHLETLKVFNSLLKNNIEKARKQLAMLVSRDTQVLEKPDIIRSVIETISENLTDGIIAPLFYMSIGGIKLAFLYKAVNTLDSMIGYKNEKYKNFGYFAAKIDDILNFIPARIAGMMVVVSSFILGYNFKNSFKTMLRDHDKTDSPNSGWTEAAFAGALNIQLGGPTPYFGVWFDKPYIGDEIEKLSEYHIKKSYKLLYCTAITYFLLTLIFFAVINF